MNKLKIFALLLLASRISPANALSASPMDTTGTKSYYDQLKDRFDTGTPVTYEDLRGFMTGRCFDRLAPNVSLNSILTSYERSEVGDPGPGFPKPPSTQFVGETVHYNEGGLGFPSDYWDNYDVAKDSQTVRNGMRDSAKSGQYLPVQLDSGTITWLLDFEPNKKPDMIFTAKKFEDEIVVEASNLIAGNSIYSYALGKTTKAQPLGPFSYCYYFKKLGAN